MHEPLDWNDLTAQFEAAKHAGDPPPAATATQAAKATQATTSQHPIYRPHLRVEAFALIDQFGWLALPGDNKKPSVRWNVNNLPGMPARDTLARWWRYCDGPQIIVLTGTRSGIIVADIDPRHGGTLDTLWSLGWRSDTVQERSASGGYHIYAQCPAGGLRIDHHYGQGIELLADGAVVAVAPSMKADGTRYEWLPQHSPFEIAVAPLPDDVLADLRARKPSRNERHPDEPVAPMLTAEQMRERMPYAAELVDRAVERAHQRADGGRHVTLIWLASRLAHLGLHGEALRAYLFAYQARVKGGWSE